MTETIVNRVLDGLEGLHENVILVEMSNALMDSPQWRTMNNELGMVAQSIAHLAHFDDFFVNDEILETLLSQAIVGNYVTRIERSLLSSDQLVWFFDESEPRLYQVTITSEEMGVRLEYFIDHKSDGRWTWIQSIHYLSQPDGKWIELIEIDSDNLAFELDARVRSFILATPPLSRSIESRPESAPEKQDMCVIGLNSANMDGDAPC